MAVRFRAGRGALVTVTVAAIIGTASVAAYQIHAQRSSPSECEWIRANYIASEGTITHLAATTRATELAVVSCALAWTDDGCPLTTATMNDRRLIELYRLIAQTTGRPPGRSAL